MRTGLIAEKVGMTRIFTEEGDHIPVTVLKVDNCQVIAQKTQDKNGYVAVQLGAGKKRPNLVKKPMRGVFAQAKVEPKRKLAEFRVTHDCLLDVATEVKVDHFDIGALVDVSAVSIGKGFAGVMKRWNFSGLRASHGVSISHRSQGSTGQCQDPGKVFKGKKMAGQMGNKSITVQNLKVVAHDLERGLLMVKGAVPGAKGVFLRVQDAVKKTKN